MNELNFSLLENIWSGVYSDGNTDLCIWSSSNAISGSKIVASFLIFDPSCRPQRHIMQMKSKFANNNKHGYSSAKSNFSIDQSTKVRFKKVL